METSPPSSTGIGNSPRPACDATVIPEHLDVRLRPIAHPAAPAGWINDPNAPMRYRGRYHLFYQHNPREPSFDPHMHWGHLSSADLARWRHHPIALAPHPEGPDRSGCWSGCAVIDDAGRPHILYSTPEQWVCSAVADDDNLLRWRRLPTTPALFSDDPTGSGHHRDPCVFRHEGAWLMVMGGQRNGRGCIELWRSLDLEVWEHLGCALRDDGSLPLAIDHGAIWECASLFPLDGRWVLLLSCCNWSLGLRRSIAYVGDFNGRRFLPDRGQLFDYGPGGCYAGASCLDERGRRLLWYWIGESAGGDPKRWGWAGCLSWPLELYLSGKELRARIPNELAALRRAGSVRVPTTSDGGRGRSVELSLRYQSPQSFPVGVRVFDDRAGRAARIAIDPLAGCLTVDRGDWIPSRDRATDTERALHIAPLDARDLADCHLRVIVDRSLIQVQCNDRIRITTRAYPDEAADGITLFGGEPDEAQGWDLAPCILNES